MTDTIAADMAATLAASPTINDPGKKAAAEIDAATKNAVSIITRAEDRLAKLRELLLEASDGLQKLVVETVSTAHDVAAMADEMDKKIQAMMQEKKS